MAPMLAVSENLQWLDILKAEYREMPGLSLTKEQMQRLWGLESSVCQGLIDALVTAHVLRRTASGCYVSTNISH